MHWTGQDKREHCCLSLYHAAVYSEREERENREALYLIPLQLVATMGLFSKKNKNKQGSRDSTATAAAPVTTDTTATVTPSFSGPTDRIQVAASNDVDPTVNGDRLAEWVLLIRYKRHAGADVSPLLLFLACLSVHLDSITPDFPTCFI